MIKRTTVESERKNAYRSKPKRVGLELTLRFILSDKAAYCTRCAKAVAGGWPYEVEHDWSNILTGLPYQTNVYGSGVRSNWRDCETHGKNADALTHIDVSFWLPAERSKEILSESQAMTLIANESPENEGKDRWETKLTLEEIITQRIEALQARYTADVDNAHIAKQANHLVEWLAKEAREEAKTATDIEAKMEALKVEFQAKQESILAQMITERLHAACEKDDTDWHPRAIEIASQRAGEALEPAVRHFLGRSSNSILIKMKDVAQEETAEVEPETAEEETEKVA